MNKRLASVIAIVLLGVVSFSMVGDVSKVMAANTCNAVQFVADVTIPDNTYINPGAPFTKTWRLKNVGLCSWSNKYALVFSSGERMGGMSPIFLPHYVAPNQNVDISVDLTAPTNAGTFRGYWMMQNGSGSTFGIGGGFAKPFWVQIRVLGPSVSAVAYDFVANMCSALWVYDGGPIQCPVNNNKKDLGYVLKLDNPTMENGSPAGAPALLTVPQNKFNGVIQGIFPIEDVFRNDHFQATIGCQYGAVNCAVTYQIDYRTGNGSMVTLWKFKEQYDGLFYQVDLDLTPIANRKDVKLVLSAYAAGPASGDLALWVAPRIVRNVVVPNPTEIPPTPTPIVIVGTSTPFPSSCTDRAQFVTDVTVPDGTTFTPNAGFVKTWRLQNVGTCTWTTAYSATFVNGERMGAIDTPLTQTTLPGQSMDISVNLTAPSAAGSYRGFWELKNPSGAVFGIGSSATNAFWVDIKVAGTSNVTPTATPPGATQGATATTQASTPTSTPVAPTPSATPFASGWNLYQNTKYAFAFQIPPNSAVASQSDNSGRVNLPFASGTNLVEKYMALTVIEGASTCKSPYTNPNATSQNVTFNGIAFLKETSSEGALSNIYDWTAYSTVKGNACVSLTFILHSINPGVFPTPPVLFDPAAESAVFSTIMSTYGNR